jgi:hypothetical protein
MRTGNTTDGLYFFLLILPLVLSYLVGELLRKKIVSHFVLESNWSQNLPMLIGNLVEVLIIITGVLAGFLLIKLI